MKKKFHLMQVVPPHRHKLLGCNEMIEAFTWGLEQLGYEVGHAINSFYPDCRNIIFGAQVLPIDFISQFPDDTIIYNVEQMRGITGDYIRPEMHYYAQRFEVWDYKAENLDSWATVENTRNIKIVPIGYAPVLTRIPKPNYQDIDVLIYGLSSENRLKAFDMLAKAGFTAIFACGTYGEARDNLIARAKLIVNVTLFDMCKQFEIVRVSYLLANKKAVVSVLEPDTIVEDSMKSCVKFSNFETLVEDCRQLLDNDTLRTELEHQGFDVFSRFDMRDILKTALDT